MDACTVSDRCGSRGIALGLMATYAFLVLLPLVVVGALRPAVDHGFIYTLGKNLGLVGFTIMALQFVLSARFRELERPFGLDTLFRFHKAMAILALALIMLHPVLLVAGEAGWSLVLDPRAPWPLWLGRIALVLLWVHVWLALFRSTLRLPYETWRTIHNVTALTILLLGFLHAFKMGGDMKLFTLKGLWIALLLAAAGSYLWHRWFRRLLMRRHPFTVTEVRQETRNVWTIKLAPPAGTGIHDYLPGQFHFLTFQRDPILPVEEHPWTISSSPTEGGFVSSTIKEAGDFTVTIGKTRPGDTAIVHGPFGRFSYLLHPEEKDFVFIAGGIGITPIRAMLRHMVDTGADARVLLIDANRTEEDIVFREELDRMKQDSSSRLEIVHVLSDPGERWQGERGALDHEKLLRYCGMDLEDKAFYICAPPPLIRQVVRFLEDHGVASRRIHFELFSL